MEPVKDIRILHISTPTSWRGGEQQLAYLIEELQKKNVVQHVLCRADSEMQKFCIRKNIPHNTSSKITSLDPFFAYKVKSLCTKHDFNLIHTHDAHAHSFAIMAAAIFRNKVPLIVSRRVDFPIKQSWFSKFKYNHKHIKRILCVSNAIKEITGKDIVNKSVLKTVYSGIDPFKFDLSKKTNKLRTEFKIVSGELLIGNASAIAPHKDYFTFVDTIEELVKEKLNAKFFIIGAGPLEAEIKDYIELKKLGKHVIFTGFRNDIPEILPELDLFLITSKTEGLGTSILDAFACKVPVVATNAGGISEIVEHRETGMLSPIQQPKHLCENVVSVLYNEDLRKHITNGGFNRLNDFTREKTAEHTLKEYISVIKESGL